MNIRATLPPDAEATLGQALGHLRNATANLLGGDDRRSETLLLGVQGLELQDMLGDILPVYINDKRAVADSLAALRWLRDQGCRQFFFKICSTFDSTREGNIGPVLDALVEELKSDAPVIICPAFPANGRTVFQGHLFVGTAWTEMMSRAADFFDAHVK